MRSTLLEGTVGHARARPFKYGLAHSVFYVALDLAELDEVARSRRLISRNRTNVLTFRDSDHFVPPADDLPAAVAAHLRDEGFDSEGWRITLITNLRVLGYVFNPASFYLCRDEAGTLRVVIVEVHNTHHERHLYTLRPDDDGLTFTASMDKAFYVSPFIESVGRYSVRVRDEAARVRISIDEARDGALVLHTRLDLTRRRLTDRMLVRMLLRHPFITQRTIGLIHWHALRLWLRGARFHRHAEAGR